MAQTSMNIRMDEELKKNFEDVCQQLGLNMTTAITIFAKKMSREKRIPFEISIDSFYSMSNMESLKESMKELKDGKVITKTLYELDEMENA